MCLHATHFHVVCRYVISLYRPLLSHIWSGVVEKQVDFLPSKN